MSTTHQGTSQAEVPPTAAGYEPIGRGQDVFESAEPVEGRVKWLETPEDVIAFVDSGQDVSDVIVVVRGGATTFLTMALNAGVRGVLTLQGAPESHLGILSREYGIPCIMSVAFEKGVRTARGEVVPADGVGVRLDVSSRPLGDVSVEEGAPTDDTPIEATGPALTAEELAQIQNLLENFRGEVPHGTNGHEIMMSRQRTRALELDDASVRRELSRDEANDVIGYLAWNEWDALAARATEGESGLIPRQEYEATGIMNCWFMHPEWLGAIQEKVGIEGIIHKHRIAGALDARQSAMIEDFGTAILSWADGIEGPRTLVHQDLRLDNLMWDGSEAWLVDWQTLGWASPAWDLAFLLETALEAEERRALESELLDRHVQALQAHGVTGWNRETAWREHRRLSGSVLLAMVAALAFVQPTERGFAMFGSLLRRGAQQAIDHDLLAFA